MGEPSADTMYRASADVLAAAAQIGAGVALPTAEAMRQKMVGLLRNFVARCREVGVSDAEIAEARYALVAFIDDRVLKSDWPGRSDWMSNPLQLQFFREYTAGENFFARMRALTQRGGPTWALEIYYLCLGLGFIGAMTGAAGSPSARAHADAARAPLLAGKNPARFAPNAVPSERRRAGRSPFPIAVVIALTCALLCVVALGCLQLSLTKSIQSARGAVAAPSTDGHP